MTFFTYSRVSRRFTHVYFAGAAGWIAGSTWRSM